MGLNIWFMEDVARIVASLGRTAARYNGQYQQGYLDALGDVAIAFGLQFLAGSSQLRIPEAAGCYQLLDGKTIKEGDNDTQMDAL